MQRNGPLSGRISSSGGSCLSLVELHSLDWEWFPYSAEVLLRQYLEGRPTDDEARRATRQHLLDRPMLILAAVFVPLARAEANRARRQYPAALRIYHAC